jgi:hypothetical protein
MIAQRLIKRYNLPELVWIGGEWLWRRATARWRRLPDFMIIGAQRSGTTSLYQYLIQHPSILPAFIKEPHFFDRNYHKGIGWYRSFFPLHENSPFSRERGHKTLTGEATPIYLFDRNAPPSVSQHLPHVKLIILLRNPVDRAYSHYQMNRRLGIERASFQTAITKEMARLHSQHSQSGFDQQPDHEAIAHFSYLARGVYIDQINRWRCYYPEDQVLIIFSEDFFRDPQGNLDKVFQFLNLPSMGLEHLKRFNAAEYLPLAPAQKRSLEAFFAPHNLRLIKYTGLDPHWRNEK